MNKLVAMFLATAILALASASAWAQQATDYTITTSSAGSLYETPPASATTTTITGDDVSGTVNLPFTFNFFGTDYTTCTVSTNGWLSFVVAAGATNYGNSGFPLVDMYTSASMAGTICPYWDDLYVNSSPGLIKTWITGNAPNRHFVVSWESVTTYPNNTTYTFTFQCQLYEGTNNIVLSYPASSTWNTSNTATIGIEAADGTRYQFPSGTSSPSIAGQPPNDYLFSKPRVTLTGRVLYDRYVVDSSGIGNSSQQNIPLIRTRVDALDGNGSIVGSAYTDTGGYFSIDARGANPNVTGSIVVRSQNDVCSVVATSGGTPYGAVCGTNVSYAQDANLGTLSATESNDAGGVNRAPVNVATIVQQTYDWAHARSTDVVPVIEILYSTGSTLGTSYTAKSGTTPATMRISGLSSNPDGWDADVIRKTYARHILGAIAADPSASSTYSTVYDGGTDAQNAFAEAFGYYVNAVIANRSVFYDGVNATTTNVLNLESPNGLHSTKGPTAASWVTEALYDLVDGANESWDTVDGTGSPDRIFQLVDAQSSPVTAQVLYDAWIAQGYDGPGITTNFIYHGLLADDADEPNDDASHPKVLDQFGVALSGRVLNKFNEDWYAFTLPQPTHALTVAVVYDRAAYATASMILELRNAGGQVIGTGSPQGAGGPISLVTGQIPAGSYVIRVALAQGGPIAAYSLTAFAELSFISDAFPTWTVGRPYSVNLNVTGGIPPYGLTIPSPYSGPEGLVFDGDKAKVTGVPTGPTAGLPSGGSKKYDFLLAVIDGANPQNKVSKLVSFTLNDVVRPKFGEFTAFAQGKTLARAWPMVGGTPPYVGALYDGQLPDGVAPQNGDVLKFVGSPTTPGVVNFKLTTVDAAGYVATSVGRGVTCIPVGDVPIAAGTSACGCWFDALKGTTASFSIAPGKKAPIRADLRVVVLDVDGNTALPATVKAAKGKAAVTGFVAPSTGRYFVVMASDDSTGVATTLTVKSKITPPKGGAGPGPTGFDSDQTYSIVVPAIAGCGLTFAAKPDKSGLQLGAPHLYDPSGVEVTMSATEAKVVKGAVSIKKTLPTSGNWTVVLTSATGPAGTFTYSYKLAQPKAVFSLD